MDVVTRRIPLSSMHVRWCEAESAFVARSDLVPAMTYADPWSSLAAVDGFLEALGLMGPQVRTSPGEQGRA